MTMVHPHPTEETLEEYIFKRLPAEEVAALEDHLFLCPACQIAFDALGEYILLLKIATAEYESSRSAPSQNSGSSTAWRTRAGKLLRWRPSPSWSGSRFVWAGAGALLLLLAGLLRTPGFWGTEAQEPPRLIALAAFRGADDRELNVGPAHKPFDLLVEAGDLPVASLYRIEVVTSSGRRVWSEAISGSNGELSAHVDQRLNPGVYWVRLSASSAGSPAILVREFGLRLE